jgi:alpha-amylase
MERDLTAWRGNKMQHSALEQAYSLGQYVRMLEDPTVLGIWRKLLTSDHYYYMCTKWFSDGDVHAYFSPYESPYEAFVTFMNAFKDFKEYFTAQALSRTFL